MFLLSYISINIEEKKEGNCTVILVYFASSEGVGGGRVIWRVAMYTGEYNLHVTRPVGECLQKIASNLAKMLRRDVSTRNVCKFTETLKNIDRFL